MLKKHLTPCLIIIGLLIMAQVFAYKLPTEVVNLKREKTTAQESAIEPSLFTFAEVKFADENLPLGDVKIKEKLKRTLVQFSQQNSQTTKLHRIAAKWFPIIEPILESYGIPNDFKYIVLVESGMQWGVSHKGAAGYWQFMPGTARHYGLKVGGKKDERYNLEKSTIAAAKYLNDLYETFNSWTLAAAAYNVGDNHLKRQINRQKQDNYFKLKLNKETGSYLYKILSIKEILENPERNGYKDLQPIIAYKATEKNNDFFIE